jgi:mannan endo-1,4-beta-mannosidase
VRITPNRPLLTLVATSLALALAAGGAEAKKPSDDLTATSPATTTTTTSTDASGFVRRSGAALTLNGVPYRFTGLNIYNANSASNCWYTLGPTALSTTLNAMGSGKEAFRGWFFQALATRNGVRDWTAFDQTIAAARARGVKVIATLGNEWNQCEGGGDYATYYKNEAWYRGGYRTDVRPGTTVSYRQFVSQVVSRYKNDPTILAWQLVNEAEDRTTYGGACSSTAAASLKGFATDMAAYVKSIDPNHLLSLGTMGSGQCGSAGSLYKDLHSVAGIDLCEYHDYQSGAMPGDQWNGLATRIQQCRDLGKPTFVGEVGIKPTTYDGTLAGRADVLKSKLTTQFQAGLVGLLSWDWRDANHGGSSLTNYEIGPSDPALTVLGSL